jgi:hypothetical protein
MPQSAVLLPSLGTDGLVQRGGRLPEIDRGDERVLLRGFELRVSGERLHRVGWSTATKKLRHEEVPQVVRPPPRETGALARTSKGAFVARTPTRNGPTVSRGATMFGPRAGPSKER